MVSKIEERIYLDWFIREVGLDCNLIDEERESPDFIIDVAGIRTGIEVTRIFSDSTPNASESVQKKKEARNSRWLSKLAQKYYAMNSASIYLSVFLRNEPSDLDGITEPVLDALTSCQLESWQEKNVCVENCDIELRIMCLDEKLPRYDRWKLINDHVAFAPQIDLGHFERALASKEAKIESYLQSCGKIWLLIVADTIWSSGRFDLSSLEEKTIETKFDELWFAYYPRSVERLS